MGEEKEGKFDKAVSFEAQEIRLCVSCRNVLTQKAFIVEQELSAELGGIGESNPFPKGSNGDSDDSPSSWLVPVGSNLQVVGPRV